MKKIFLILLYLCIFISIIIQAYSEPYHYPVQPGDSLWKYNFNYLENGFWGLSSFSENIPITEQDLDKQNLYPNYFVKSKILFYDTEYIKILTPLGNQPPNNQFPIATVNWSEEKVEQCNQAWLYFGGLFKLTEACTFIEKNNFLTNHKVLCMEINGDNIYIGTENGIFISTDYGDTWLAQNNDGIDDNILGKKIYAISVGTNKIFTCSDDGLYISNDSGDSWEQYFDNIVINCIEYGNANDIYVGTNGGVYKSTNSGSNWSPSPILSGITNCLLFKSDILYAGIVSGLKYSSDDGANWYPLWSSGQVISIYVDESDIYIGTYQNGCIVSLDGGNFNLRNTNFPLVDEYYYYSLNSLKIFDDKLYAATGNIGNKYSRGLFESGFPSISWSSCDVIDGEFHEGNEVEIFTRMLYIDITKEPDEFWIACWGEPRYTSATKISSYEEPMNPANFPYFNCFSYAWHLSEGGESGVLINAPNSMNYITTSTDNWVKQNWDYIKTTWDDPLWEKVNYNWNHSGIKSPNNDPNETDENKLLIESKWGNSGPLVEHKLKENPYYTESSTTISYWKSRKLVSGNIQENVRIGREITTLESEEEITTIIPEGYNVEFYIAPMYNHIIDLKPGFHAVRGSTFHAFVKDYYVDNQEVTKPCQIPWEEDPNEFIKEKKYADNGSLNSSSDSIFSKNNPSNTLSLTNTKIVNKILQIDTIPCKEYEMEPLKYSGKGSGTEDDPYQITDIYQFQEMSTDWYGDHYWILMNDIDASVTRYWNPRISMKNGDTLDYFGYNGIFGNSIRSLDGRGHIIRNLYQHNAQGGWSRLIRETNCFSIKRIGFENIILTCFYNSEF